jgi:hypothetical protein
MNATSQALDLTKGLILKLSCTTKQKACASELADRLNALLSPITQLNSGCLHDPNCESEVSKLSEKLMKRGKLIRFIHSGGIKKACEISTDVGDLNLIISTSCNRIQQSTQLHDLPRYFAKLKIQET